MLDLSLITAQLTAECPSLEQIILPDARELSGVDSALVLRAQLSSTFSGRVYPLKLPDSPTYPCAVYELASAAPQFVDGYQIMRVDEYLLAVMAEEFSELVSKSAAARAALIAYDPADEAGSAFIDNRADRYEPEIKKYHGGLTCQLITLAQASQALPAAFVYLLEEPAEVSREYGELQITTTSTFAVLWAAKIPAGGISALASLRKEITDALNGFRPTGWELVQNDGGTAEKIMNRVVLWREIFSTQKTANHEEQ